MSDAVGDIYPKSRAAYPVMSTDLRMSVIPDMFEVQYYGLKQIYLYSKTVASYMMK